MQLRLGQPITPARRKSKPRRLLEIPVRNPGRCPQTQPTPKVPECRGVGIKRRKTFFYFRKPAITGARAGGPSGSSSALAETPTRKAKEMSNRVPVGILGGDHQGGGLVRGFDALPAYVMQFRRARQSKSCRIASDAETKEVDVSSSSSGRRRSAAGVSAKTSRPQNAWMVP